MQPAVVLLDAGFRVRQDPAYRESVGAAHDHHLPHSGWLSWSPEDRDADTAVRTYRSESCPDCGIHPSTWDPKLGGHRHAVVAEWKFCRVCELLDQAKKAGPPTESGGWRLGLKYNPT